MTTSSDLAGRPGSPLPKCAPVTPGAGAAQALRETAHLPPDLGGTRAATRGGCGRPNPTSPRRAPPTSTTPATATICSACTCRRSSAGWRCRVRLTSAWFRVTSEGAGNVPRAGPAILVANHSGTLPVDALMLCLDVLHHTPRIPRAVADRFVPRCRSSASCSPAAARSAGPGPTSATSSTTARCVVIFPEGTTGVAKPFRDRYQLQDWRVGHVELAIRHRAPVVPAAIIGAEESWPQSRSSCAASTPSARPTCRSRRRRCRCRCPTASTTARRRAARGPAARGRRRSRGRWPGPRRGPGPRSRR